MISNSDKTSGVEATVYYWPKANYGLGHIACVVDEVKARSSAFKESIYISPAITGDSADILDMTNIDVPEEDLEIEMGYFDSPDVIKIEMPKVDMSYQDFLTKFSKDAKKNLDRDYNLVKRNCAHMANRVLDVLYEVGSKQDSVGLLPKTVAKQACAHLDKVEISDSHYEFLKKLSNANEDSLDEPDELYKGVISKVPKYQFAKAAAATMLRRMTIYMGKAGVDKELGSNFVDAKENFLQAFDDSNLKDKDISERFDKLHNAIENIDKSLDERYKAGFQSLKKRFYGFLRIFSKDPALEMLRTYRSKVEEVTKNLDSKELVEEESKQQRPVMW